MYEDPFDMFPEMDEIFNHLFAGMRSGSEAGLLSYMREPPFPTEELWHEEPAEQAEIVEPADSRVKEPVPEMFRDSEVLKIVVDLPGITEENLNITLRNDRIIIDAVTEKQQYQTYAAVPADCDISTLRHSLKNGVLELSLDSKAGGQ